MYCPKWEGGRDREGRREREVGREGERGREEEGGEGKRGEGGMKVSHTEHSLSNQDQPDMSSLFLCCSCRALFLSTDLQVAMETTCGLTHWLMALNTRSKVK